MSKKNEEKEKLKKAEKEAVPKKEEDKKEEIKDAPQEAKPDPKDVEIEKLKDQLMRNMAEYDNYRKRTSRERIELEPELTAKIVTEFLPVIDNVERALSADCADEGYKKGIELIYQAFTETLAGLGVEEIATENADFDPTFHQAVQQVEGGDSGKIASTFQKGYKIGSRVLRFAMVAVNR